MPRNNDRLALLAVSLTLSILQNTLAGQQYPLNYGNSELRVKHSQLMYTFHKLDEPSSGKQDHSYYPLNDVKKTVLLLAAKDKKSNLRNRNQRFTNHQSEIDHTTFQNDLQKLALLVRCSKHHATIPYNNLRTSEPSKLTAITRATNFRAKILEQAHLSSWISRVAIKDMSNGVNPATYRLGEPGTPRSRKTNSLETIRQKGEIVDFEYPYYGYIGMNPLGGGLLATTEEEKDMEDRGVFSKDFTFYNIEGSRMGNGLETKGNTQRRDAETQKRNVDKTKKIRKKGYITGAVNNFGNHLKIVHGDEILNRYTKSNTDTLTARRLTGKWNKRLNIKRKQNRPLLKFNSDHSARLKNFEISYFLHYFKSDSPKLVNRRCEAFGMRHECYNFSKYEGLAHDSASHKSAAGEVGTGMKRLIEVSTKQRSTIKNDIRESNEVKHSGSIRKKRNPMSVENTQILNTLKLKKISSHDTFNKTIQSIIKQKIEKAYKGVKRKSNINDENIVQLLLNNRQVYANKNKTYILNICNNMDPACYNISTRLFDTKKFGRLLYNEDSMLNILYKGNLTVDILGNCRNSIRSNTGEFIIKKLNLYTSMNDQILEICVVIKNDSQQRIRTSKFSDLQMIRWNITKDFLKNTFDNPSNKEKLVLITLNKNNLQDKANVGEPKLFSSTIKSKKNISKLEIDNSTLNNELHNIRASDSSFSRVTENVNIVNPVSKSLSKNIERIPVSFSHILIAAMPNFTYELNNLSNGSFNIKSNNPFAYEKRSVNDPIKGSPFQTNKLKVTENMKIREKLKRLAINYKEETVSTFSSSYAHTNLSKNAFVEKEKPNITTVDDKVQQAKRGMNVDESTIGTDAENALDLVMRSDPLHSRLMNERKLGHENERNINGHAYQSSKISVDLNTATNKIPDNFLKQQKSRSSKIRRMAITMREKPISKNKNQMINANLTSLLKDSENFHSNGTRLNNNVTTKNIEVYLQNLSTVKTVTDHTVQNFEGISFGKNMISSPAESITSINNEYSSHNYDRKITSLNSNGEELPQFIYNTDPHRSDNSSYGLELNQWPVKHSAVVEGDLILGGLMMVHEREDTVTCGPVMPQGGVQALEVMLYTLDRLNEREIIPGVKIGAHILDDCDKDTYGLEMAVDFIKGSISNIDGAEYHCNKTAMRKVISGVVGAASSVTSIQVANLLRLFRIPQVSFFSTSPELSNKQRFEYFTRTIPSDHYQVKAMVDIVLTMGWSYISIIYEESNYGIKAFEELEELLGKYDICIAIKEKLVKDSGVAEETAYDNIVLKLLTKPRARGCIIFGSDQEVAGVMRAVRRCNATGAFSWIGSDGWSARGLVSDGNEAEVEGTLSVQPQANSVKGFEEYFLNLTVENNQRNPWFVEFWEDHFQCRYPNASKTPYNQKYTKACTTKERLTKQNTAFEDQLQFVSDAVMAFGYAFRDMHRDLCHEKPGLCDSMKPTKGTELLKYLRKVDFEGLSGDKFRFDKNGDGPARYNIIHFKQIELGKYKWVRVGKYLEGELRLNMSEIQFRLGHPQPPESVCSLPCEVGQAKKYVEGERCCWHCFNCTQYQIRHPKDETQCISCRQGTVPNKMHSTCRDIPEEFLRPESGWAIGAMSLSTTGMLVTFFVCGVFLKHNDTPVVRASGRELSYVLLSGIVLCYLVTFALVLKPTNIVCGIQRFAAGFCFTVVYAALLTKTNRISRIFNSSKHSAKRPSFISPRSQLIICSGLVFVQILINGIWMIVDPANAMHHYPNREDNLLVCNSYVDASYMIAFAYPIMLIVVCTIYAVLTRKIPEAFNESKHIGFTMYTTCVIWLAFVPLYFGTGNNVALRITSMSVTISLSASVTIACLFTPKLYIILIRPERNVRQSMMPTRYGTTKSSAIMATNAPSMITPVSLTAATCDQNKAVKKHIITTIDCSTQSEYYELEVQNKKNSKPSPASISRSTQTSNNSDDESHAMTSNIGYKESTVTTKQSNNNARIRNGPMNKSVSL